MGKLNSFQGSIACLVLKAFAAILRLLPLTVVLFIGRRLGDLAYWFGAKNRRKAYSHVRVAFGRKKTPEEIRQLVRDFYQAYGQSIVEIARFPLFAREGYQGHVEFRGRDAVDQIMKKGKGLIILSMHSGNWELANLVGSMSGYPYNMVANYLVNINKVADYLDSLRTSAGCRIINPGISGREIIRRLKKNEVVTLVADQGGDDGILVPFFGRDAAMSTGGVRIALKYGVPICLVDIQRVRGKGHQLVAHPFEMVQSGDFEKDVLTNLERMRAWFQARIAEHPHEYLWFYNTWKHCRRRQVLLLDDGRTGHLRQSEAVAAQLRSVLEDEACATDVETVIVEYRSSFHAGLLSLIAGGLFLFSGESLALLEFFLKPDCFQRLFGIRPDFIISCGAKNAGINYWLARDNRAKSIVILRPGLVPYKNFDLVVLPEHDRASLLLPPNVLLTKAAPNLIGPRYLEENKRVLLNRFSHLKMNSRPKFGLIIGGDTKGVVMTERQIRVIVHQLKEVAENYGADLLITTSRRTSAAIERLLWKEFNEYKRTALLIVANKSNVPEAMGGILALSDILIVSGESISMVSEAAASGKKTVVFPIDGPDLKPLHNKYSQFVDRLGRQGYIVYAETSRVAAAMDSALRNKIKTKPLDDQPRIIKAVRKLAG